MFKRFTAILLTASFLIPHISAYADTIITNSGNTYNGKITSLTTDSLEIKTSDGNFQFNKDKIKEIKFHDDSISNTNTYINTPYLTNNNNSDDLFQHKWKGSLNFPGNKDIFFCIESVNNKLTATVNTEFVYITDLNTNNNDITFTISLNNDPATFKGKINKDKINGNIYKNKTKIGIWEINKADKIDSTIPVSNTKKITIKKSDSNKITLNPGFEIPLYFPNSVMGNNLDEGDMLPLKVYNDIVINDTLIFKKDTAGLAVIGFCKKSKSWGRGGKLAIEKITLSDEFGNEYDLAANIDKKGNSSNFVGKALPIAGGLIVAWPLLFFGFKKGKEVKIPANTILKGFITQPTEIKMQ